MALPDPGMTIDPERTALVVTDPQNDFLSPDGATWGVVGKSVTENNTVENIESLFVAAKETGMPVFVSPHYYYPTDHEWHFEGALEALMHNIGMFDRPGALSVEGFEGSGADWLERYKPYIEDGKTVISNPHKMNQGINFVLERLNDSPIMELLEAEITDTISLPGWPYLWSGLVGQGQNEQALFSIGSDWLTGREDRPEWNYIWRLLIENDFETDALLPIGSDWLTGREDRPEWAHVYRVIYGRWPNN